MKVRVLLSVLINNHGNGKFVFQLIPIAQTFVDWNKYLTKIYDLLGRSATTQLDAKTIEVKRDLKTYLSTLNEIENQGNDPFSKAGILLEHIHLSFILIATKLTTIRIIINTRLTATVTATKEEDFDLTILSGNLLQWQTAIQNCCLDTVPFDVREFGSAVIAYLDHQQLTQFMSIGMKVPLSDGTFRLIEKK